MMNLTQHALGKIAEECSEVAKVALKAQQFGLEDVMPTQFRTNAERLEEEWQDLISAMERLRRLTDGLVQTKPIESRIVAKDEKVERYLKLSVNLNMVRDHRPQPSSALSEWIDD